MAPIHKVAVIQWHIKDLAPEENHTTACNYIRQAARQGAALAVLPEYHLTGWAPENPLFTVQAGDSRRYLESYQCLAKELNICLVPGTIVEPHVVQMQVQTNNNNNNNNNEHKHDHDKPHFYNTAYFINNNGRILTSYRKKNLWHPEREYLSSSGHEPHDVVDTPVGKVGLLICWDLAFPEAFRELIAKGAQLVVLPTFWTKLDASPAGRALNPDSESLFLDSTITSRCFENTCAIIFANATGPESDPGKYLGMSRVSLPFVGPVGKMGSEEGLLLVDLDLGVLVTAEENYGVRRDIASDDWYYTYRHDM